MFKKLALVLGATLALSGLAACGTPDHQEITVFAAASLRESFTKIGEEFERLHPGVTVRFNFGGSPDLVAQVNAGSPADVLATASTATMANAKGVQGPRIFATNTLEIVVPASNPAHITSLADLAKPGVKVALCAAAVPCGSVAAKVLKNAHVSVTPVSREADVKSVLTKVSLDEVDAGLVYVTDVTTAKGVTGIPIPAAFDDITQYPIARVTAARHGDLADLFMALVLAGDGQKVLKQAGFGPA